MNTGVYPLVLTLLLTGCAGAGKQASGSEPDFQPDPQPLATTMVYDCNGYEFVARLGPGEMAIWLPDDYLVLSQVRSGSGTKYQEGNVEFWSKGDEAILTVGEQSYRDCQLVPERVPWEDARRRGVDFRAVGNEPGWSLEIQSGRHLLFVGEYGMQRIVTPDPGEHMQGQARIYQAVTEATALRVEIVDAFCTDTMSGESFPNEVVLTLNDTVLYGCGRSLDYPWE